MKVRSDKFPPLQDFVYPPLRYPIFIDLEVYDEAKRHPGASKRLGLVLSHLAASGKTTVVKGCRDSINKGWLRTPLGGSGGMHYYLWWARAGSSVTEGMNLPGGSILISAIRHHDNHAPLAVGEFHPLTVQDIASEQLADPPWTKPQIDFVHHETPVRVLIGNPGSGKTTALWQAVAGRDRQKVLYLTWSRRLAEAANEHFATFAPTGTKIVTRDFRGFVSEILGRDLPHMDMVRTLRSFKKMLSGLPGRELGAWRNCPLALFAEIRAVILGQVDPKQVLAGISQLSDAEYIGRRGTSMGIDCAERVARIFTLLLDHPDFAGLFSDIHAAMEALRKLESTAVPTEWGDFDRIAIDEIQDLTAIEFALISSFHTQISTNQGRLVWLLLAGDEGQTVVPTDFSWGAMKSQLHASLNCLLPDVLIEEFKLESNLRCPHKITEVINRSAGLYRKFPRAARPANQTPGVEGQALQAQLLRIACSREEACYAVGCLAEEGRLIFLRLDSAWPDWIPKKLRDFILTPEEAKGLEYQAVCILDPGKKLAQIEAAAASGHELEELAARAMIDRLRVALSPSFLEGC